ILVDRPTVGSNPMGPLTAALRSAAAFHPARVIEHPPNRCKIHAADLIGGAGWEIPPTLHNQKVENNLRALSGKNQRLEHERPCQRTVSPLPSRGFRPPPDPESGQG